MASNICNRCGAPAFPTDLFCGECGHALVSAPGASATPRPATSSPLAELPPGMLLQNRYEIVKRVGGGGMGNVYKAYDRNLDYALRAVKEMMEMFSDPSQREKAVEDFRREAKLLASLKHPSIPVIYDHFIEHGRYYLVMEFIRGGDLMTRLRYAQGRVPEPAVTMWAIQIADVLDYLHRRQPPIIYRDLKPANVMVDPDANQVMLIDFGIARTVAPMQAGVTAIGTMGYAPPELFSGKVEPRSDIYSLGATMFHLLTGVDPRDKPLLIFDFTKNPKPRELCPELTPRMEAIIMRAVEYEPANRFPSAREMKIALQEHLQQLEKESPEEVEKAQRVAFGEIIRESGYEPARRVASSSSSSSAGSASMPVPSTSSPAGSASAAPASELVFCSNCGTSLNASDLFCALCGARQPISLDQGRASAKLLVLDPLSGQIQGSYMLEKHSSLIGRMDPVSGIFPEIDLSPLDTESKVSRRHARVWRQTNQFFVEDLNSINGTHVNDELLVPKQPVRLKDGDVLRVGQIQLVFKEP
ncbi:MAG: protein kinase [Acidobacteriota bacterium]|nr:protein kinase [Blastocatellia bacterium]MDW8238698.1 protein kinase [Acidobacteriota bacterium]